MDSRTTQGTSSASMILLATVVLPEALPPHRPAEGKQTALSVDKENVGLDLIDSKNVHVIYFFLHHRKAELMFMTRFLPMCHTHVFCVEQAEDVR